MSLRPIGLAGSRGTLAGVYYPPAPAPHPAGSVLVAPAFAEEMNRTRAMISMQARALASQGIGTLVLDPFGTGDSEGEFSQASWDGWRDDLRRGIDWLRRHAGGCRTLWGVRLGALMAAELAASDRSIDRLLLWQPVVDAKAFYTQFLRIRIAAELEQSGGIKTTDELRRMSAAGEIIEVSGYPIGPQLASDLDRIRMPAAEQLSHVHVMWCEVAPSPDAVVPRANTKLAETYRAAGVRIELERVIGPPFWQVHERVEAAELLPATSRLIAEAPSGIERRTVAEPEAVQLPAQAGTATELGISFACEGEQLMGIVHRGTSRRGVVIVVAGGPQYRAGAHRQFVSLARELAARGHPVLRFDLRGMGDSGGRYLGFQHSAADIRAAIDALIAHSPGVEEVALLGECESASGILFYAFRDARVQGIALVNPWVRTEEGRAEVILKHYYASRLLSGDFWRKVAGGRFSLRESLRDLIVTGRTYWRGRSRRRHSRASEGTEEIAGLPLPEKTAAGLRRFRGHVMILMSGRDYIAREFDEVVKSSGAWRGLLAQPRVLRRDLAEADHTFSREAWKSRARGWVCEWLAGW